MLRMMIVDDEERIANSIYNLIVDHFDDLEVYRSYSAHQALKIIKSMRFDLVMLMFLCRK